MKLNDSALPPEALGRRESRIYRKRGLLFDFEEYNWQDNCGKIKIIFFIDGLQPS